MAEKLNKQDRIEYIDFFRAFGIILMIMGHIKFGNQFGKWIHAFHMPMFFFISGWFYESKGNLKLQILKKVRCLLLPYVLFEVILWMILMAFIPEYRSLRTLFYIFVENTYKIPTECTFGISPIPGAMWFLTSIFFVELIYILLDRNLDNRYTLHICIVILVITGMFSPTFLPYRLPWALDASFVGVGLFHIARMVKEKNAKRFQNLQMWQAFVTGIVISLLILISPDINMRTGAYGLYFPFWINALGAILSGWNLSKYVERLLTKDKMLSKIVDWLKGIGKNSIVYLCLNQVVILGVTKLLNMIGFNGVKSKIPILMLTIAILFLFEKLICETKLKVIIGK